MPQLSRREFLNKSTLALAAAPILLPRITRAEDVGANNKIRLGVIGSGDRGQYVLGYFLKNPEVDCVIACDVDDVRSAKTAEAVEKLRGKRPDTCRDFRRVLDRKDIDAVLVATPDHWHALPTVHACQAGKDVYVEKPLAKTIDEGRAMLEASLRHKRIVQMGTQWRSGTHFKDAVDFIHSGKLGKVGLVRGWVYLDWVGGIGNPADSQAPATVDYDMWLGPAAKHPFNKNRFHFNFRWFWDYAGGLMTDWGVHLINVMLWAMGPEHPKSIMSSGGKFVVNDNTETPDTQVTVYEFPSYMLLWEHRVGSNNGLEGQRWGIRFTGSEGTLLISEAGWEVTPERKSKTLQPMKAPAGPDEVPAHVRNFLDCIKSRLQPNENLTIGHHVSSVAHLGNIAYRTKRKIFWDGERERILDDGEADQLVGVHYRRPWHLPYSRRG
jgi:predicted dehydrogenase